MNYVKHRANTFRKQTKLPTKTLTFSSLSMAANKIGYIVKPYSTSAAMMISFGVYEETMSAASVSVKDNASNVIIFINDRLSADKQLFALAHEIGHIYLGHNNAVPKEKQEEEANKFAAYLLGDENDNRSFLVSMIIVIVFIITMTLTMIFDILSPVENNTNYTTPVDADIILDDTAIYYWSETGYVFHYFRDCRSLKYCDYVFSGDLSEAMTEKERLCKFCEKKLK